jgi:hypothetical protein
MKPVTLWYREAEKKIDGQKVKVFEYNHLEDGHNITDKPTPKHPDHSSWAKSKWQSKIAHLNINNVVIMP